MAQWPQHRSALLLVTISGGSAGPQRAPKDGSRTWRSRSVCTEREVTVLLSDFAAVWSELFPAEQARIVQLLVERVDVQEDALEVRIRAEGLVSLVGELLQDGERKAA
jgi:site-specific DNA recombinase